MKKYRVIIEETIAEEFEVEAATAEEAISKSIDEYHAGNFVLSSGEVQDKKISVAENDEFKNWISF